MKSTRFAFLTDSATITGVEQYRVCSPLNHLGLVRLSGKKPSVALAEQQELLDAIVIQRDFSRNISEFKNVVSFGNKRNIPVVLDLDDYLFDLPMNHPARLSGFYADALLPLLNAILLVDAVTVTTNILRDALKGINPSIFVLPNYLDNHLWKFSPVIESPISGPVRIVFIGTPTHQADVQLIDKALVSIADKYGRNIDFMFIGTSPPSGLDERYNVVAQPNMIYDYRSYIEFVQSIHADIAIAPLEDNLFNRCKSPIKFFEYASLGLPGVFSDLDPYQSVIRNGENGFLAKTTEDWVSALSKLIEDSSLRHTIAESAQRDVKQNWVIGDHLDEWKIAYGEICAKKKQQKQEGNDRISAILNLIQIQLSEVELLRAKREYKAAKTIVQLRNKSNQLEADLNYHQQLKAQLEEANHQLDEKLTSTQQALNAAELRQNQLHQQQVLLKDQEQRHILQLSYLRRERERLANINVLLRDQNINLSNELNLTKQEMVNYALSSSWKLTRPLRSIKRKLRHS